MTTSRRNILKGITAVSALGAVGFGFSHTANKILKGIISPQAPRDPISGNAPVPEFTVDPDSGELIPNPEQYVAYTMCLGCTTACGMRVRVDKATQQVLRVTGNPYHLLSSDPHLPYQTSVKDSFTSLSRYQEQGLVGRSTACARGNLVLDKLTDPHRVKVPLKRVGPRGSGRWAPISPEQLLEEVVEGGDLFGEGKVEGLRAIRDLKTPIDPARPELGPQANQLAIMPSFKDGRVGLAARFAKKSFGTVNIVGHSSYCGLSMRMGYAALLGNWKKLPHLKPDFNHARFLLFIGTAPANAGNPFKRQAFLLARARTLGKLKYVVVDPLMTNSVGEASNARGRWISIRPNTDGALVMAMIRWIIENKRYDANFLSQPNLHTAKLAGEAAFSNATHLVITEEGHPRQGYFLRHSELVASKEDRNDSPHVVFDIATKKWASATAAGAADILYQGIVTTHAGEKLAVKTSLALLREEALKHSLDEYAEACGIAKTTIVELASEFTAHGKRAAADCHGGTMGSNGFYTAYAITMLNTLVGNLNRKGGTSVGGGHFRDIAPGPRYNLKKFPGMVKAKGLGLGRQRFPYHKSSEFKQKQAQGGSTAPDAPWFRLSPPLASEFLSSALNGYPYSLKAIIFWSSNPLYGVAGLQRQVKNRIRDPKILPLIISVDPFINETNTYADYVVPDTVLYESWGWTSAWGSLTKVSTARWPVIDPAQVKDANGQTVCMEWFFIEVAKRMGLPGFGNNAIKDKDGGLHPLNTPEDFYLRAAANAAYDGSTVPDASDDEIQLSAVYRIAPQLKQILKPEEWRKAAYVYARGGRFEDADQAYQGETLRHQYKQPMQLYDEMLGTTRNSYSNKRYTGSPTWVPASLADGSPLEAAFPSAQWPFKVISSKSQLQSSHTIGLAKMQQIHPENPVAMHSSDAAKLGVRTGDMIRITTPGASIDTQVQVREGIQPGVLAIEHGFGHRQLGGHQQQIGQQIMAASALARKGLCINDLGFADPVRKGISVLTDFVVGNVARQGLPAKVEKI